MPPDGSREHNFFDVAALADEILDSVAMVDADDILFDDGAIVEDMSDVVSGRANQLHSALKRLMVGLSTDECRQKGMVNIDDVG